MNATAEIILPNIATWMTWHQQQLKRFIPFLIFMCSAQPGIGLKLKLIMRAQSHTRSGIVSFHHSTNWLKTMTIKWSERFFISHFWSCFLILPDVNLFWHSYGSVFCVFFQISQISNKTSIILNEKHEKNPIKAARFQKKGSFVI